MEAKNLPELMAMTEDEARSYLEQIRWPEGPVCVHCGNVEVTRLQGKAHRPGVYKCRARECRKQFTVTVNTIFHRSRIPLNKWVVAFHLMCSSKKGISALQLQRNLGLKSYQAAWHMAHRIRHAMQRQPLAGLLTGVVEVDESFLGGKPRYKMRSRKNPITREVRQYVDPRRKNWSEKVPVMVLVSRDGEARSMPVERVTASNLKGAIRANVHRDARIMTDENRAYHGIGNEYRSHETVNHLKREYARGDVSSNTAESYFALLKRGVHGAFHHVSKTHLGRYCDEFSFRWTHRGLTDAERTVAAIQGAEGRRLVYKLSDPRDDALTG